MTKITQYSAKNLIFEAGADPEKWNRIPSPDIVEKTVREIEKRGIKVILTPNGDEALSVIK
jgi:sugar/nucleoside kinase (ribokinase family)